MFGERNKTFREFLKRYKRVFLERSERSESEQLYGDRQNRLRGFSLARR